MSSQNRTEFLVKITNNKTYENNENTGWSINLKTKADHSLQESQGTSASKDICLVHPLEASEKESKTSTCHTQNICIRLSSV